jgi:hypothetical protein
MHLLKLQCVEGGRRERTGRKGNNENEKEGEQRLGR